MEGMEMGYCTAMGHDFISVSLVGAAYREAFPVYARLGRGRHCHADLIYGAVRAVMERTGGLGWLVFDRGMDDARFLRARTGELGPHEEPRLDRVNRRFGKSRSVFKGPGNISRPVFSGVS